MFAKRFVSLLVTAVIALLWAFPALAQDVSVRGYTRKDGTYVRPHMRSKADGNFYNNWSTVGNVNPYTGKAGTKVSPPDRYGEDVAVRGHVRKDGTFVKPHMRSAPDGKFDNNWSTKGNFNPYTGKEGTRVTPPAALKKVDVPAVPKEIEPAAAGFGDTFESKIGLASESSDSYFNLPRAEVDPDYFLSPEEKEHFRVMKMMQERRQAESERRIAARQTIPTKEYSENELAKSRFTLAHRLYQSGKVDVSRRWLEKLVDEYPATPTAAQARVTLALLGS